MKFSGKVCFKKILKVTKHQCFTLSLTEIFFEKLKGWVNLTQPSGILQLKNSDKLKEREQNF